MRRAKALFGVAVLTILAVYPAAAADPGKVSFCFNNWPPYAHIVAGEAEGLSISILREAARRAGLEPSFSALPWKRCLQMVEAGEIDAVIDAADREGYIHGSVSFSVYTNTFWVRAGDRAISFERAARDGYRLGLVTGYIYGETLDRLFERTGVSIDKSVDDSALVRKLGYRRTDIIIADFVSTRLLAAELGIDLLPLETHSLDRLYTSFNPSQRTKMEAVYEALAGMCDDGSIRSAYIQSLGQDIDASVSDLACSDGAPSKGAS